MGLLNLDSAQKIVILALEKAREMGLEPMTVVVLDASGTWKAMGREDGSGIIRPDIAFAKAWGAVGMGLPTRELVRRQELNPLFFGSLNSISQGRLVANPGGVLIMDSESILGSVGVTGDTGDNDEIIAVHGIEAAGFRADCEPDSTVRHSPL